jgi:hypothetical protein
LFRSEFFFRTTRELEYLFFLSCKARFFFQNSTLGYMTKTLNQIIFFSLHQNQNIFFSNIGNQNILLEKKHNPPLQVKWSFPNVMLNDQFRHIYLVFYNANILEILKVVNQTDNLMSKWKALFRVNISQCKPNQCYKNVS